MSDKIPDQNNSEEVDLGQLFTLIGNAFNKLFSFIASIFKTIFSVIVLTLKAFIVNFKIIVITMIIAGVLGFFLIYTVQQCWLNHISTLSIN